MVVREPPVNIHVHPGDPASQQRQRLRTTEASHAVPAIHDHMKTLGFHAGKGFFHVVQIIRNDRSFGDRPVARLKLPFGDVVLQRQDGRAMQRLLANRELEAVVLGGIVARGDHDAAADRQGEQGKI